MAFLILRQITLLTPHPSLHTMLKVLFIFPLAKCSHFLSLSLCVEIISDVCSEFKVYVSLFTDEDIVHEELYR